MYLFFDRQGTLLEIVNDVAMRQYNTNVNKIYVHIQDDTRPTSGKVPENIAGINHRYLSHGAKEAVDGKPVVKPANPGQYNESFKWETVPYNRDRDLKHFVYGRRYEFFVLDIPSGVYEMTTCEQAGCDCVGLTQDGDVFNLSGTVLSTIQIIYNDRSCLTLEKVAFTVEEAVIMPEKTVTGSQFAWLLSEFLLTEQKISGFDNYNNLENVPVINADLSSAELVADTYYKHTGEDGMYKTGVIYYYNGTKLIAIDGGTSLTLNGEETDNAAIYAPISGGRGTIIEVLVPHGDGKEPTWEELKWTKNEDTHTLTLGGKEVGTFEIPKDVYVSEITFDKITRKLNFKRTDNKSIEVDLSSLVDFYVAGDGLQKTINSNGQNEFSIRIADNSYLYTDDDGDLTVNASGIAGLAKIKLNGSSQTANTTTFYAPKSPGSSGNILFSNGGGEPTWGSFKVNGSTAKSANIFAPTRVGSSGQVLLSDGSGAPSWADFKVNNGSVLGKSIYAPTEAKTPESNTCWVLAPNGSSAPVWEQLTVEKNGLVYTLKLGDIKFGEIALTEEVYLKTVRYDEETNKIVFTYNTVVDGDTDITLDVGELFYSNGNGLELSDGVFSIKIAPDSEKYLKATAEGLVFDESALPKQGATGNGGAYIVKTEDEIDALLVLENVGKLVSYIGADGAYEKDALYLIASESNAPIAVGDTLNDLYFNTNLSTAEVDAILDTIDWSNPDEDMGANVGGVMCYIAALDGGLMLAKLDFVAEGTPVKGYVIGDSGQPCYASNETVASVYGGTVAGWDESKIAEWKSSKLPMTVESVNDQQDIWGKLISKEPFTGGGIIAKPACPDPEPELPVVTASDSGKFLRVDANGKWVAQSIPYAEEASF